MHVKEKLIKWTEKIGGDFGIKIERVTALGSRDSIIALCPTCFNAVTINREFKELSPNKYGWARIEVNR